MSAASRDRSALSRCKSTSRRAHLKWPDLQTRFYATSELGPKQAVLPSGTLWCRDVTIARTGTQRYHITELPELADTVTADSAGMFDVERDPDEVFDPASMASFEGAAIVLRHPDEPVDPTNWSTLAIGHAQNVRRAGNALIADLLVSSKRGIRAVRDLGWRAISCGYDARYEPTEGGRMRQVGIVGNHIALLGPDEEARCGDLCRVGDTATPRPNRSKPMGVLAMSDAEFDAVLAKAFPKRKPARDQIRPDYLEGAATPMGKLASAGRVGGELVMILPDDRFMYYISKTDSGEVGLFRHGTAEGSHDPGLAASERAALMKRETTDQATMRGIAARQREFWKQHANG